MLLIACRQTVIVPLLGLATVSHWQSLPISSYYNLALSCIPAEAAAGVIRASYSVVLHHITSRSLAMCNSHSRSICGSAIPVSAVRSFSNSRRLHNSQWSGGRVWRRGDESACRQTRAVRGWAVSMEGRPPAVVRDWTGRASEAGRPRDPIIRLQAASAIRHRDHSPRSQPRFAVVARRTRTAVYSLGGVSCRGWRRPSRRKYNGFRDIRRDLSTTYNCFGKRRRFVVQTRPRNFILSLTRDKSLTVTVRTQWWCQSSALASTLALEVESVLTSGPYSFVETRGCSYLVVSGEVAI